MAGHQNDHARLLPAFRISAKMRRYLVRLRVSSGDFDQADPEREARYKKSGCEMMAILVHHRKKRIPLGAATQATCDALHAAAQLQFAGDQRDEVRRSRDQSIEIPQERNWRWKEAIEAAVESRGWTPVLMAWFSAGRPKAS